jgi:hypothetical protein
MTEEEMDAWVLKECSAGRTRSGVYNGTETRIARLIDNKMLTSHRKVTRAGVQFLRRFNNISPIGPNIEV